jgi:RNA polymerase sigma-70 factor (ECF subfamily)
MQATLNSIPAVASLDDGSLIHRAVAGDTECFTAPVQRHLGILKNHIRSLLDNKTDLDDLVQEVLVKLWIHLPDFRFESSLRAWVTRIATNEVLQGYRRQRRRGVCLPLDDFNMIASRAGLPLQRLIRVQQREAIQRAISRLPTTYGQILRLRYIQQKNERETASCLQSSIVQVKNRSFRARQMLRASLQRARV